MSGCALFLCFIPVNSKLNIVGFWINSGTKQEFDNVIWDSDILKTKQVINYLSPSLKDDAGITFFLPEIP